MTYTDIETGPDPEVPMDTLRLSDDSRNEWQDSPWLVQTKWDTEQDAEDDDIPDANGAGLRHQSWTVDKQTYNQKSSVRVPTNCGSQEAVLVRQTLNSSRTYKAQ